VFAGLVLCFCGWVVFGDSAAGEYPSKNIKGIRIRPTCPRQRGIKSPAGSWVVKERKMTNIQIFLPRRTAIPTFPILSHQSHFPLSVIEPRTQQHRRLHINHHFYANHRPIRPHYSQDVPLRIHGNNQRSAGHELVLPTSLVPFYLGQLHLPYITFDVFCRVVPPLSRPARTQLRGV
jgi:hypothetical protein